jgi:hypothetical protein
VWLEENILKVPVSYSVQGDETGRLKMKVARWQEWVDRTVECNRKKLK